ncbi:MAG: AAA family ATPase [Candidatus Diapherotrites archaeon]
MERERIVSRVLEANSEAAKRLEGIERKRFAFNELLKVVKEREYFLGITGLRGIGKTVLLLQLSKAANGVYFSADDRELRGVDLYDVIKALSEAGHKKLFVDEIHAKAKWDVDLKTIFDERLVSVTFTGSSAIQLKTLKADLSRRVVLEHLRPAGFREWLEIKKGMRLPKLSLKQLLKNKAEIARKYGHANRLLQEYYTNGGVLYDAKTYFYKTIISTIETIAAKDLPSAKGIDKDTEENFFKLLQIIASSKPLELSYSKIGETMGKNKVWVMRFLYNVEKTEAIRKVYSCGSAAKSQRKEAKYYLPMPYRHALCTSLGMQPDTGAVREEFFVNHLDCCYFRTSGKPTPDFKFGGMTFEIGGKGKGKKQGADIIVTDTLDTSENKIPLFTIGLL